jgi:hypothetical protein
VHQVIKAIAEKMKLPYWWVQAIAIEYTDCREYATRDEVWTFNLDKVSGRDLEEAVRSNRVVVFGTLVHNVLEIVWSSRTIERLVSDIPAQLAEEFSDVFAEGPVSNYHFPFLGNPLDVWDPKLDFSSHFQVLDEGQLWQWRIAEFVPVQGRTCGKWISSEIDLEPLDKVHEKLASLRNPVIKPGEPGHADFEADVKRFYDWLDEVRRPILSALEDVHVKRRIQASFSKVTRGKPPLLSRFEMFTVRDGQFYTKALAEPVFFRGCRQHATRAEEAAASVKDDRDLVSRLDEVYQERAGAIIMGTTCAEAFINAVGFERFPDLWKGVERISLKAKWRLYLELVGKGNRFDPSREPHKSLAQLIRSRNFLVHFKRRYSKVKPIESRVVTDLELHLPRSFVRDLPKRLDQLIRELCEAASLPVPPWLTPEAGWGL